MENVVLLKILKKCVVLDYASSYYTVMDILSKLLHATVFLDI